MDYLTIGTIVLIGSTALFYAVFTGFAYYYHERKTSTVIVPVIYTFYFFLGAAATIGLFILGLIFLDILFA